MSSSNKQKTSCVIRTNLGGVTKVDERSKRTGAVEHHEENIAQLEQSEDERAVRKHVYVHQMK